MEENKQDKKEEVQNKETEKTVENLLGEELSTAKKTKKDTATSKKEKNKKKKKVFKQVKRGRAYIQATYNNTIVALTDPNGNMLTWSSAGSLGFKGPKKATPYAAGIIAKDAVEKAKQRGLEEVVVYVKGVGLGRESAVRALHANGLNILSIKDVTPIPHNGCRRPRKRRV